METEKPFNRVGISLNNFIMKKLKSIKGLLSREEMRQIQGGSGNCTNQCTSNSQCYMGQTCLSRYCAGYPNWRYCG